MDIIFQLYTIIISTVLNKICNSLYFLKLKVGALSYHLRRKQLYITSRSERHHHKYNAPN
jgi:c-di-AMP phosphodiesterase-like protein